MKKKKDLLILKGQLANQTYNGLENRIQLFDGKYTTGYRVKEIRICPSAPQNQEEVLCVVSTEPLSAVPSSFDFSSNTNVAYVCWNAPNQTEHSEWKLIIRDNMAIEDLWIGVYSTGDETLINYYMELEKWEFPAWTGAGILVENISQAGPQ